MPAKCVEIAAPQVAPVQRSGVVELTQRRSKRGVRCEQFIFSAQSVGRLTLTLYQLLRARSLALPQDDELLDELANVRLRETSPGTYWIDHDPDRHDERAIALALAAHHLVERGSRRSGGGVTLELSTTRGTPEPALSDFPQAISRR